MGTSCATRGTRGCGIYIRARCRAKRVEQRGDAGDSSSSEKKVFDDESGGSLAVAGDEEDDRGCGSEGGRPACARSVNATLQTTLPFPRTDHPPPNMEAKGQT